MASKTNIDFSSILGLSVGSAPEPKALPEGTYYGTIAELPQARAVTTKEGDKPVLTIVYNITEASDDVDQEALEEAGGLLRSDGQPKQFRHDFWIDENSRYRLDAYLAGFGFNADSGKSYTEALEELVGRDVTVAITQRQYQPKNSSEMRTVNDIDRAFVRE